MHTPAAWLRWCLLAGDGSAVPGFSSGCERSARQSWWVREGESLPVLDLGLCKAAAVFGRQAVGGDLCAGAVCRQRGVCALLGQEQRLELLLGSVPQWSVLVILSALSSPFPSCPSL